MKMLPTSRPAMGVDKVVRAAGREEDIITGATEDLPSADEASNNTPESAFRFLVSTFTPFASSISLTTASATAPVRPLVITTFNLPANGLNLVGTDSYVFLPMTTAFIVALLDPLDLLEFRGGGGRESRVTRWKNDMSGLMGGQGRAREWPIPSREEEAVVVRCVATMR
jgi:hypothetical protein